MKTSFQYRLTALENRIRCFRINESFEEWLQEHYPEGVDDYWKIVFAVPQEFSLHCLNRAIDQARKKQDPLDIKL